MEFILTDYINNAMANAEYDKIEDGSFVGRIPKCKGVIAFAETLREVRMSYARHWRTGYSWVLS
jgi:hypothetical protein